MGKNIVGIEKKSAGQIYRNTLYCLFLTNRATHDSTLLGCPKLLVVEIAFPGFFSAFSFLGNYLSCGRGHAMGGGYTLSTTILHYYFR